MNAVVLICAEAEWRAVRNLFPNSLWQHSPFGEYTPARVEAREVVLFHSGWGKIAAAAATQYIADQFHPDLLINLGTCGGVRGRIEPGTVILVEKTIVYDIVEQMGDPREAIAHYTTPLDLTWLPRLLPIPVLRGLLVSGDRDLSTQDLPMLIGKYNAVAADWESGAIAWVARRNGIRLLMLRGVTDLVDGEGGEAYGDYELFSQRTREIMRRLVASLPEWLNRIEKVQRGYRV